MLRPKLCVFDLDGTLNQTHLFAVPAHLEALKEFGVTNRTAQQVQGTFGERADDYVPFLLGRQVDPVTQRSYLDRVAHYENEFIKTQGRPYDGAAESLTQLKNAGILTAVCSNASYRYIDNCLKELGLKPLIDRIQPLLPNLTKRDTLGILLKEVSPAQAVMVGDRKFDWEAAQANGIPFIGCRYGYNPREMECAPCVVSHAGEIFDVVQRVFSQDENDPIAQ